jgi:hypothetical protein
MATQVPSSSASAVFDQEGPRELAAGRTSNVSQNGDDREKNATNGIPEKNHEYVTGSKLMFILVSATLVYFLLMLDGSVLSTTIPQITSEFDSLLDVGW